MTGDVSNLSEVIARLESLTGITTLDLSQVTGVTELRLENTTIESIKLEGNLSITRVEIAVSSTLETLNSSGSSIESVNAKNCSNLQVFNVRGNGNLTEVNIEGCVSLAYLDVSYTKLNRLDVKGFANLKTMNCTSCLIEELNLEGCNSIETVACGENSLRMLDASGLTNLRSLECSDQSIPDTPIARQMNFVDFLLGQGAFEASALEASNEAETEILRNVKNLKAYSASGSELSAELNLETGEAIFGNTPAKVEYDYATGFKDVMMNVEAINSEAQQGTDQGETEAFEEVNPSSGGCVSGFGAGAIVLLVALLRKRAAYSQQE